MASNNVSNDISNDVSSDGVEMCDVYVLCICLQKAHEVA